MKAADDIRTPAQYIASLSEERRAPIRKLHGLIRKAVPDLNPVIIYGMLGYGKYHYKYASGREGDAPVVALASQKNAISLYVSGCEGKRTLVETFKARLGKVSVGKCCIRFRKLEDLDIDVAMELVSHAARLMAPSLGK